MAMPTQPTHVISMFFTPRKADTNPPDERSKVQSPVARE